MSSTLNFTILSFLLFIVLSQVNSQNSQSNGSNSEESSEVKVIVSIVVIFGIFIIGLILLIYCYKNTKKIEKLADETRANLAKEYQSALNLQIDQAIKVNTYLLKSLAPEKPLMGKSMFNSSWRKGNSPKKIKAPGEQQLLNLNKVEMSMTETNKKKSQI